jgi:hypothetical protein
MHCTREAYPLVGMNRCHALYMFTGAIHGGAPPKIGKNIIFGVKSCFSHEIPQKFSRLPPLGAIILSAPPP